jgi:hypothetical protein
MIDEVYNTAAREAAAIGVSIHKINPNRAFSFADYPSTARRIETLLESLKLGLQTVIVNGVHSEWTLANNKNNELCNQVFGDNVGKLPQAAYRRYYSSNPEALEAFTQRKVAGLRLSDRVWNYTNQFKDEIELGLDVGIRDGLSADEMSRQLRTFLKHPDKLFRRVRDKDGNLLLSKRAAEFHPGQGVYRSSYKNARRLAATETNIAYRTADYLRWQNMDFVVGILIEPPKTNHVPDICDDLKGRYPKDFKWTGWHPHCRCHALTILKTREEMNRDTQRILQGEEPLSESENKVSAIPDVFNKWIDDNRERAKGWASMPYFVRDNPQYVSDFRVGVYSAAEKKFTRAYHTSPAMKQSLALFLDKKYPDIKNTEKAALIEYTRGDVSDFRHLNKELMQDSLSEFNVAFSELLSSALSKLPTEEATVYRTIRLNKTNLEAWKQQAVSKAETSFQGFTSTSDDFDVIQAMMDKKAQRIKKNETDVLLVIKSKTGHRISEFSKFPEQRELLFDKGMRLRYDRLSEVNGQIVFHLTEI